MAGLVWVALAGAINSGKCEVTGTADGVSYTLGG